MKLYLVKYIPAGKNGYDNSDSFHYDLNTTSFPDLLMPIKGEISVKKGEWNSIWVEYSSQKATAGKKKITIVLSTNESIIERTFTLNILDKELPKQELLFTNWFHNDCLCTYYGVEVFSEDY